MTNAMLAFVCLVAFKAFMFGYLIGWSQCRRFKGHPGLDADRPWERP